MTHVLFFSYFFPPMGGGGVQRSAGFVRHLPEYGYRPHVVTAPDEEGPNRVNPALLARFHSEDIHRSDVGVRDLLRKLIVGNGLIQGLPKSQDRLTWWTPGAVRKCVRVAATHKIDLLYTSVNPWAAAAVGRTVARRCQLPWVIDFRDPWAIDDLSTYLTRLHYQVDLRSMRHICQAADAIIMNTPLAAKALFERFPNLPRRKVFCITNGYDVDSPERPPIPDGHTRREPMHIVYSGELFTRWAAESDPESRRLLGYRKSRWKYRITDQFLCRPGQPDLLCRSPYYFFSAVKLLLEKKKILPGDMRVTMVGNVTEIERQLTEILGLQSVVTWTGYVPLAQSFDISATADVLLLLQHKRRNDQSPLTVPGKLYEYLRYGKPILALVPSGDARTIVEQSGLGHVCEPDSIEAIAQSLFELVEIHKGNRTSPLCPDLGYIAQFSRRKLTEQLANVFAFASHHRNARST